MSEGVVRPRAPAAAPVGRWQAHAMPAVGGVGALDPRAAEVARLQDELPRLRAECDELRHQIVELR